MSGCNSQQKIVSCFWYLFSSHLTHFAQKKGEPMKQNKTYLHLGVTLIVSACAVLMFYDTFFQSRVLLDFFDKLMQVLSPVIYGLVFAYLLAPIVDFFDRYIQKGLPKVKSSLVRGLSILVTWICVIALIYLMFSILIPELVDSTKTLADNFESY